MKVIHAFVFSLSVLAIVSCGNGEQGEEPAQESVAVASVTPNATSTLDIEGMTCEVGCKGAIEKHMSKTAGVASCNIDFESEVAVIEYDNKTISEDDIIAEIGTIADHAYTAKPHIEENEEPIEEEAAEPTAE